MLVWQSFVEVRAVTSDSCACAMFEPVADLNANVYYMYVCKYLWSLGLLNAITVHLVNPEIFGIQK